MSSKLYARIIKDSGDSTTFELKGREISQSILKEIWLLKFSEFSLKYDLEHELRHIYNGDVK